MRLLQAKLQNQIYNVFTIFLQKLIRVVETSISNHRSLYEFLSATLPFCITIDRLGIVLPPLTIGSGPSTSCFLQGVRSNVKGKRRGKLKPSARPDRGQKGDPCRSFSSRQAHAKHHQLNKGHEIR